MLNGTGLRVVLWVSGCGHNCRSCQNPQTHNASSGIQFDINAHDEIIGELRKDYISGLTFSGGDPLFITNLPTVERIAEEVKALFPQKNIWLYTGFLYENVKDLNIMEYIDVLVDGKFIEELSDSNYPWAGSTNQRIIDVTQSRKFNNVTLWRKE